jgi:hypothetical protein
MMKGQELPSFINVPDGYGLVRDSNRTEGVKFKEIGSSILRTDFTDTAAKSTAWVTSSGVLGEDGNSRIRGVNNYNITADNVAYMSCDVWSDLGSGAAWQKAWTISQIAENCGATHSIWMSASNLEATNINTANLQATNINTSLNTINSTLTNITGQDFLVFTNLDQAGFPNSKQLQAGSGISINTTDASYVVISATLSSSNANTFTKSQTSALVNLTTVTGTVTINASNGNVQRLVLGGNITLAAPTNPLSGQNLGLHIIQDATGGRTITWNAIFKWAGGTLPTLSTAANARDFIAMTYDDIDNVWICSLAVKGAA